MLEAQNLRNYIVKYYKGNQAAFARAHKLMRSQVTYDIKRGDIVVDHVQYSKRKKLKGLREL